MDIPPRLIEAAARALAEDDGVTTWDSEPEYHRDMYRETAGVVLEAAFLECGIQEFARVQFGDSDFRRYSHGGKWDPRPVSQLIHRLMDTEDNLVVERKLVIECFFPPIAVRNEEVL